jgi:hypothetical protein
MKDGGSEHGAFFGGLISHKLFQTSSVRFDSYLVISLST